VVCFVVKEFSEATVVLLEEFGYMRDHSDEEFFGVFDSLGFLVNISFLIHIICQED